MRTHSAAAAVTLNAVYRNQFGSQMFFFPPLLSANTGPKVVIIAPTIGRVNIVTDATATASVAAGDRRIKLTRSRRESPPAANPCHFY